MLQNDDTFSFFWKKDTNLVLKIYIFILLKKILIYFVKKKTSLFLVSFSFGWFYFWWLIIFYENIFLEVAYMGIIGTLQIIFSRPLDKIIRKIN